MKINVQLLHKELAAAGLPVTGVWYKSLDDQFGINYSRALSVEEKAAEKAALDMHDPNGDDTSKMEAAKVTDRDMLIALWCAVADGDTKKLDAVKAALAAVGVKVGAGGAVGYG